MTNDKKLIIETSPDKLSAGTIIKRINKVPILIVMVILIVFMGCIFFVLQKRSNKDSDKQPSQDIIQTIAPDATLTKLIQEQPDGLIPDQPKPPETPKQNLANSPRISVINSFQDPPQLSREDDESKKIRELKLKMMKEALYSDTKSSLGNTSALSNNQAPQMSLPDFTNPMSGALENLRGSVLNQDPNKQDRKNEFITQSKSTQYLSGTRTAPITPYEIKAGAVIPAVMVSGVNSDLPGQLIAQVSQHVYDTAEGNHVLIPQGSKLIGFYDSHVAYGQKRVLVAWHRVIFPDASTLELENMSGSDQAGYAGFNDKVNTHFWKIFGNSFMLSVMSAGFQMSQPENADPQSPQSQLATAMGQQFSELGMEIARKNLDIQPTLEIRPGYRFNVMVNKDILFEMPYQI